MIKRFLIHVSAVMLAFLICTANVRASGPESDEKTATVLYSDIVAYINGFPIETYNIDGRLAVTTYDLMAHGLCNEYTTTEIYISWNDSFVTDTYEPEPIDKSLIGTVKEKFTYYDGEATYYVGDNRMIYTRFRPFDW